MPPKRRHEHGSIIGGRLQLDRETRDVIRSYTRLKYRQAVAELERARAAHERCRVQKTLGELERAEVIVEHYETLYSQGQHSVNPVEWAEAWVYTTTTERHAGVVSDPQPSLPGMEG